MIEIIDLLDFPLQQYIQTFYHTTCPHVGSRSYRIPGPHIHAPLKLDNVSGGHRGQRSPTHRHSQLGQAKGSQKVFRLPLPTPQERPDHITGLSYKSHISPPPLTQNTHLAILAPSDSNRFCFGCQFMRSFEE